MFLNNVNFFRIIVNRFKNNKCKFKNPHNSKIIQKILFKLKENKNLTEKIIISSTFLPDFAAKAPKSRCVEESGPPQTFQVKYFH